MKRSERRKVAREAARLLYYNLVDEYKQAKEEAARSLKTKVLPSNFEVAVELDHFADEVEGSDREKLIVDLRREALQVMRSLEAFHSRLIGSVWRGTARKGSDIDIEVFCQEPESVVQTIEKEYNVPRIEQTSKTERGETDRFFHIHFATLAGREVEVVVKDLERIDERRKCDIYDDLIVGLTRPQLQRVLEKNPRQKFVPKER